MINSKQQAMHVKRVNPRAWPAAFPFLYVPSETQQWPAAQLLLISTLLNIYDKFELIGRSEGCIWLGLRFRGPKEASLEGGKL